MMVQICHQHKGPGLVYKETNSHDGNAERCFSEHQERRLGCYNRPQGHLPSRAYCEGHRRFFGFWWQDRRFQFRRLPYGLSSAPRTFTTITLPVFGYVQGEGDSIDSLFGRFPGVGSELETVDFSHQYSLRHFRPGWIPAKLKEMSSATQTEVRILVPAVGLEGIASDVSGGEDHKISIESLSEDGSNISRQL